ncbi:MAG: hypothetical protein AAFY71_07605 [Bacteroidota bacterium]
MKRFSYLILILLVGVSCTGCFELIEELTLNSDGSGHIAITFNGSQSKGKLNSVMKLETVNGYKVPSKSDINQEFYQLKKDLNAMSGISNVKISLDSDNFIYTVEGDFQNIPALNKALNQVAKSSIEKRNMPYRFTPFDHYQMSGRKFVRTGPDRDRVPDYQKVKMDDRQIFESGEYRAIYRFEQPIQSVSNDRAVVSKNRKAMMFHASVKELIDSKIPMANTITLQ